MREESIDTKKLEQAVIELKRESEKIGKIVDTRKIFEIGCKCGSTDLQLKHVKKIGTKEKQTYKCNSCGEKWTNFIDEKYIDSTQKEKQDYKNRLFNTRAYLSRIISDKKESKTEYFVVYNSMDNAHDFGMLTQRKLSFEEAIKEIKEDVNDKVGMYLAGETLEEEYQEELEHLEKHLEVEIGNRFYRIILIEEEN